MAKRVRHKKPSQASETGSPETKQVKTGLDLKTIKPLTLNQQKTFDSWWSGKNLWLYGCAGTGKSYLSLYLALQAVIKDESHDKVVIVRSAVSSRDMGFLPGKISEKQSAYEDPYKSICADLFGRGDAYSILKQKGKLEFLTTSYNRGITISNAMVVVDECFPYDQTIITENGKMKIGKIFKDWKSGKSIPKVKTFNEQTGEFEWKSIAYAWNRGTRKLMTIEASNRKIKCTENHRFLTESRGWQRADKLYEGELIRTSEPEYHQLLRKLNDDQYQVLLGSFLGDGHIHHHGKNRYRLTVIHGEKQENYCRWKASLFGRFDDLEFLKENGYSKTPAFRFNTKMFGLERNFPSTKTTCPQWILDDLDTRGLAIWFMDDGSVSRGHNRATISTCSFDEDSQQRMVKKLNEMGIECKYRFRKVKPKKGGNFDGYYYITMKTNGFRTLSEMIAPYVHENIDYKIFKPVNQKYPWNDKFLSYGLTVVDRIEMNSGEESVYDIEVKDNHNFILGSSKNSKNNGGIIAHNCQNMTTHEIDTIFTRLGKNSKIIFSGDLRQTDLNKGRERSGILDAMAVIKAMRSFDLIEFTIDDVVRSGLVREYLLARHKLESKGIIEPL